MRGGLEVVKGVRGGVRGRTVIGMKNKIKNVNKYN